MFQSNAKIFQEESEISQLLAEIGLSKEMVIAVARAAAAAKAETLPIDPVSAPGWNSYQHGIRQIRMELLSKKDWRISRIGNVESTVNDSLGIQLCFQNVDSACNPHRIPHAISGKGTAARKLVSDGQGELFEKPTKSKSDKFGCTPVVWVICVEITDTTLKAEVSCPTSFQGSQFEDFHQRIFILDECFYDPETPVEVNSMNLDELDVPISKK